MFQSTTRTMLIAGLLVLPLTGGAAAQGAQAPAAQAGAPQRSLDTAAAELMDDVRAAEADLAAVRERAQTELVPLRERLGELRRELIEAEEENREATRQSNQDASSLVTLTQTIDVQRTRTSRLSALLNEYLRNFEARLHIAELETYSGVIDGAKDALDDASLDQSAVFAAQVALLNASFDRIASLPGGAILEGSAIDPKGVVRQGQFLVVGPLALFRSNDGKVVGTAEQQLGSTKPVVKAFSNEKDATAASLVVATGSGVMPVDITVNKAHKIAETQESLVEHIQKGGAIMVPILVMAALALLVALYKWISFLFVRSPKKKKVKGLMAAVREGDEDSAKRRSREIRGPVGEMLQKGADNMRRSRELMEDSMYETVLATKTKLNGALPFIAICAASAPLLGLLGTVTGIINTFKQITVFGSGDVKSLSGGISQALITTEFGLIVAIPSLLLHAYLSRRARGMVTKMEATAVRFANEVARSDAFGEALDARRRATQYTPMMAPEHEVVRGQVNEILSDILGPLSNDPTFASPSPNPGNAARGL